MKKVVVYVSAAILGSSSMVYAQANTPGIDQRQANQERRIDHGIATGQLTEREATRLGRLQQHIDNLENKAKADGTVTKGERARIAAAQDRASVRIAHEKHDRQGERHR